ncbi:hypothetical protein PF005_g16391 [Phytophthora fragariae]|uniref:Uncharacterized protein n=1 Tax=Phytophthora fragariae TaxID=53985 RepID=A0A6A3EQ36_9STRA|nr:hypothetical protein PF003_g35875 [Phytophthora fragariae]KAE8932138.1 hypothetical protein PF009_g17821 [Phytophthora fragariae]KAE9097278.1 hypothetical protein PF007_g16681 [Phytophthora fragariae]KAE9097351.1 hypothetical protein PF010_g15993 [Phytophthora fragariae]KAE9131567.1 hypothetical protein PF006_g15479 [Phytophthora fragariae]
MIEIPLTKVESMGDDPSSPATAALKRSASPALHAQVVRAFHIGETILKNSLPDDGTKRNRRP